MTNSGIVKRIATVALVIRLAAGTAEDMVFSEIRDALGRGEKITIRGFGTFATTTGAGIGRNPVTGERIEMLGSRLVSFNAPKALTDEVSRKLSDVLIGKGHYE